MTAQCLPRSLAKRRAPGVRPWTNREIRLLRELALRGDSICAIAEQLRRSESAIRNKAGLHGISLRSSAEPSRIAEFEQQDTR